MDFRFSDDQKLFQQTVRAFLNYIESGATWPRLDTAARIAAALRIPVDALITEAAS